MKGEGGSGAAQDEADAVKMATVSWHVAHKWNRVAEPLLYVDERDPKNRIILRPVVDESWHVVGVTGVILDQSLAHAAMTTIGTKILKKRHPPSNAVALRVADRFPRTVNGSRDFVTQPIGSVFTTWRAGIRDLCASPEEVAATNFRNNILWTGGAFVVLLGAVGLAVGAVARQMRLSQMKSDLQLRLHSHGGHTHGAPAPEDRRRGLRAAAPHHRASRGIQVRSVIQQQFPLSAPRFIAVRRAVSGCSPNALNNPREQCARECRDRNRFKACAEREFPRVMPSDENPQHR